MVSEETVSELYVSEIKLLQSWRYKTLAVIKCYKNHLSLSLTKHRYFVAFLQFAALINF